MAVRRLFLSALALVTVAAGALYGFRADVLRPEAPPSAEQLAQRYDFATKVAPILAKHCYDCHGENVQEAGLRLDSIEALFRGSDDHPILTPGDHRDSLLYYAVHGPKPAMPVDAPPLSPDEVALIAGWIDHQAPALAATYQQPREPVTSDHWAYQEPERSPLPAVSDPAWPRQDLDYFVLARLDAEGLQPSPEAERAGLLRRVSLDLVGLPPTPEEVDAFLTDPRADAYERAVERLLESPHFGEHWGRYWLDLARYADTHGYHRDTWRPMWLYRDWVINALNQNMPFDQFTVEQLAGDLLPHPTRGQLIATGFHRNTMFNQESGIDREEYRVKAIVDRVATTATVWLGTTLACAQCHDHPFDPFSRQEFYELYAYFNNTTDLGGGKTSVPAPLLEQYSADERARLETLRAHVAERKRQLLEQGRRLNTVEDPQLGVLMKELALFERSLTAALVLREREIPRPTYVHLGGDYQRRGPRVLPKTPRVLHERAAGLPANRLGLARWIVDPANPLTARVTVNRFWEKIFGTGLVQTSGDFGTQGARPSHPALLDHLAVEFVESDWDVKRLLRAIVTSATYRQSSHATPEHYARDPDNRLLARGPRFRVEAETIRDVSLVASGLLNRQIGGRSVFPPQPAGLWDTIAINYNNYESWQESRGADRYRRGVYTYWRRSVPYPSFTVFDAPSREYCTVRRQRTNTPLQALTTLNDPAYVEMATHLARRMRQAGDEPDERAGYGFRCCVARTPTDEELAQLVALYHRERSEYGADHSPDEAEQLAWTVVANVLLNLDATLTKW